MFDRLANGWNVACQSWGVLRQDKQLIVFPILSGIAAILVLAAFALPVFAIPGLNEAVEALLAGNRHGGMPKDKTTQVLGAILIFAFYFVNYFVIVYFNTALAACAIYRFRGGEPTVGLGLSMAGKRLPQIAAWALLAGTVGLILNAIENRSEWLGKVVVAIIGGLWTAVTYLVVPTLAVEGLGPIDALKRSAGLIHDVWGEGLSGNFSIGLISFLLMIPAFLIIMAVVAIQPPQVVMVIAIAALVVYVLTVVVISAAVKQIFIAGLYVYATEKRVPPGFDKGTLTSAFARK